MLKRTSIALGLLLSGILLNHVCFAAPPAPQATRQTYKLRFNIEGLTHYRWKEGQEVCVFRQKTRLGCSKLASNYIFFAEIDKIELATPLQEGERLRLVAGSSLSAPTVGIFEVITVAKNRPQEPKRSIETHPVSPSEEYAVGLGFEQYSLDIYDKINNTTGKLVSPLSPTIFGSYSATLSQRLLLEGYAQLVRAVLRPPPGRELQQTENLAWRLEGRLIADPLHAEVWGLGGSLEFALVKSFFLKSLSIEKFVGESAIFPRFGVRLFYREYEAGDRYCFFAEGAGAYLSRILSSRAINFSIEGEGAVGMRAKISSFHLGLRTYFLYRAFQEDTMRSTTLQLGITSSLSWN